NEKTYKPAALKSIGIVLIVIFLFDLLECFACARLKDQEAAAYVIYHVFLFSPLIGCVVARLVTREGFRDGILWPRFSGNAKAYVLALVLPLLAGLLGAATCAIALHAGPTLKLEGGLRMACLSLLLLFAQVYYVAFITAGEELGWRALLYDKLEILLGTNGSVIVGGIIWGVWHFPALYYDGLNFGKEYPGFPFVGILLMCISTIFMGAALQLVRKMSGSVIPACIFHGVVDSVYGGLLSLFLDAELVRRHQFIIGICGLLVPAVIIGLPCWILLVRRGKKC
ncbi:MAG: CPBP family intramembrane metalloprotease, partial [Lachnospiraceae bacterium]|nr:CPBP family intramembrane metalloprotease [Lachnospiraceae bacterium]